MTARRLLLGVTASAAIAIFISSPASAWWGDDQNAFSRQACFYAWGNPNYVPPPGPTFGYGGPSCWGREMIRARKHIRARGRPLRVKG
jgi:hypothetical protein